jgi:Bacterial membrane protein YfhO
MWRAAFLCTDSDQCVCFMVDDRTPNPPKWPGLVLRAIGGHAPLLLALGLVGGVLGGLLVGYEPVGGDPDRLYRPLKSELARALGEGRLPFWSTRFGLGLPLIAESHVAAYYPPNLALYRVFDVSTAYRLSMWLHYVALVATTYLYARCLGITAYGGALAGISFALCGFQTIHSSHEPFYCVMPYLPLALAIAERFMNTGRAIWLALLALALGFQWTLGHFQIQMWTGGLVVLTGLWRVRLRARSWVRVLAVVVAAVWGAAIAALQLGLSWQFAALVRQTKRATGDLVYYSFPPSHWFELVMPRLIRELRQGPEDPYWFGQQTWGYEAALYVGTIPLVFAFIGLTGRPASRSAVLWRALVPVSFALATMPRWWPQGYVQLLALPGIGYFRVPARYTLITSLGLALLAGEGIDAAITKRRYWLGLAGSLVFGVCGAAAAWHWSNRPDVHLLSLWGGMTGGFLWGALAWLVAIAVVLAWRYRRLPSWAPLCAVSVELGILFYLGTTQWGWAVSLPAESPLLHELASRSPVGLIGGLTENLPVRAGLATAYPYIGFALPRPNEALKFSQERLIRGDNRSSLDGPQAAPLLRWFKRHRMEYLVVANQPVATLGTEVGRWRDLALDQVAHRGPTDPAHRIWSIIKLDEPAPEAHVAKRARTVARADELMDRLFRFDDLDTAIFLAEDTVPARADAQAAQLVSWDGSTATVSHVGACDLVIARTFDSGWLARIDGGPEQPVLQVDGGFQAVRIAGSGTHHVSLWYRPHGLYLYAALSLVATASAVGMVVAGLVGRSRSVATAS